MKTYSEISFNDLPALALGSGILGSGGGGDPAFLLLIAQNALKNKKPIKVLSVNDLKPDDLVIPIAHMGAPLIEQEKIPNGQEFTAIFQEIEKRFKKKPTAIMTGEIGGSNSLNPFIVAAELDLPVLDGDGMGRAFPEIRMCSFFLNNINATPMIMANNSATTVTINAQKASETIEKIARHVAMAFGSNAFIALYTMNGIQAQQAVIANTISQALEIGSCILRARENNQDPVQALTQTTQAAIVATGVIIDIKQKIDSGFLKGTVTIQTQQHNIFIIHYQNENLVVQKNKKIIVTTPDIISLVDSQSATPITTDALRFGIQVAILIIPAPKIWTTPEGLALVGPQYFGYNTTYKPYMQDKATV